MIDDHAESEGPADALAGRRASGISVAQWDRLVREKNVQPDGEAKNPMYRSGPPMRLYSRQTVARLKRTAMVRKMAASAKARGVDTTARRGELDRPMSAEQRWHERRARQLERERRWAREEEWERQDVDHDDRPVTTSSPKPGAREGSSLSTSSGTRPKRGRSSPATDGEWPASGITGRWSWELEKGWARAHPSPAAQSQSLAPARWIGLLAALVAVERLVEVARGHAELVLRLLGVADAHAALLVRERRFASGFGRLPR